MPKLSYTWNRVTAGDIISFRYKEKESKNESRLQTILVLNPKMRVVRKDATKTHHLIGLKLQERGNVPTIKSRPQLVNLLEQIGQIEVVSGNDYIYRINILSTDTQGARQSTYKQIKSIIRNNSIYRTYDYKQAIKSQVFLEPIDLSKKVREALIED